jgi:hypothetical protein
LTLKTNNRIGVILCLLLAGCGYHGEKISSTTLESIRRVAVIDNTGNDLSLLRKNNAIMGAVRLKNVLGPDVDVSAKKLLEDKLAEHRTIVPVPIDYSAMEAAENQFVVASAVQVGTADSTLDNINVLEAGLGSGVSNNVDAYIYVYRSNTYKCEGMYGLNSSGAVVLGPIVAVTGDTRWGGPGLAVYGFHDWVAGEKYFIAANIGVIVLNRAFQPIAPQLGICLAGSVDKSAWIGPGRDKSLDGFNSGAVDAAALAELKRQLPALVHKATVQIFSDMGFSF